MDKPEPLSDDTLKRAAGWSAAHVRPRTQAPSFTYRTAGSRTGTAETRPRRTTTRDECCRQKCIWHATARDSVDAERYRTHLNRRPGTRARRVDRHAGQKGFTPRYRCLQLRFPVSRWLPQRHGRDPRSPGPRRAIRFATGEVDILREGAGGIGRRARDALRADER